MKATHVLLAGMLLVIAGSCSDDGKLPPPKDIQPEFILFPDQTREDVVEPGLTCEVLWHKVLESSGGTSHPALGGFDTLYIASGQKLFALDATKGKAGPTKWVWPDDDEQSGIAPPGELYTPVIGEEGILYMGTNASSLLAVNKQGVGRFLLKLQGNISGAPAIPYDDFDKYKYVMVATDEGALYRIFDEGDDTQKDRSWFLEGEDALPNPKPGIQPIIGPESVYGEEAMMVLTLDGLHAFRVQKDTVNGQHMWTWMLPDGYEAATNPIMDGEGNILFVAGKDKQGGGPYFKESYLFSVAPDGSETGQSNLLIYDSLANPLSISQGQQGTVIVGTENAGVFSFDVAGGKTTWQLFAAEQNFEGVAQPTQGQDGLVYFGAGRHWIYVVDATADTDWHLKLENPREEMGAILWPSSPLIMEEGTVIYHNSNYVYAVKCTDAGPTSLAWPRFGGNDKNTGNIADKFEPPEEE